MPIVVPTSGNRGALEGSAGPRSPAGKQSARAARAKKPTISRVFHEISAKREKRAKGLEPSTSSLGSREDGVLSPVAPTLPTRSRKRCTTRCTSPRGALASSSSAAAGAEASRPSPRDGLEQLPVPVEELAQRLAALPPEVLVVLQTLFAGLPQRT